ncbi:CPBP family intramembrane glutamic endopeptidase [Mediterraneibacter agrestimuris]|uniref:CPBP family intramembrane glutamic endopeptidase n=1 Tax=Mediterraneibacter agrestimuris TaxID=2941333 RepID=UPI00203F8581|nr:CPBP family intramembrane glutamic endopeptidase [Mediterraneibacter agrestimuris]
MNRSPQSRRFWRILGPIMGYWGIQIVTQFIVVMMIIVLNAAEVAKIIASVSEENVIEKMAELSMRMSQILMEHQSLASAFTALCILAFAAFFFTKDRNAEKRAQLPIQKKAPSVQYIWIILFGAAFCLGLNVIIAMSGLAARDVSYITNSAVLYSEGIVVMLVCQGIIVPVSEEMMFRGVLFKRCREQMGFWNAAFAISLLFALIHNTMTQLSYTLVLGLFLAYFYEKFGSLKAPVLLHVMVNMVSIVLTKTGVLIWMCSDFMRMAVCVVGCAFAGAVAFVRIQKIENKTEIQEEI